MNWKEKVVEFIISLIIAFVVSLILRALKINIFLVGWFSCMSYMFAMDIFKEDRKPKEPRKTFNEIVENRKNKTP